MEAAPRRRRCVGCHDEVTPPQKTEQLVRNGFCVQQEPFCFVVVENADSAAITASAGNPSFSGRGGVSENMDVTFHNCGMIPSICGAPVTAVERRNPALDRFLQKVRQFGTIPAIKLKAISYTRLGRSAKRERVRID
jgi:hypothetical protein